MLFKFGVLLLLGVAARSVLARYDVGAMSPVGRWSPTEGGRTRCRPSTAFALADALEVINHKLTGMHLLKTFQLY